MEERSDDEECELSDDEESFQTEIIELGDKTKRRTPEPDDDDADDWIFSFEIIRKGIEVQTSKDASDIKFLKDIKELEDAGKLNEFEKEKLLRSRYIKNMIESLQTYSKTAMKNLSIPQNIRDLREKLITTKKDLANATTDNDLNKLRTERVSIEKELSTYYNNQFDTKKVEYERRKVSIDSEASEKKKKPKKKKKKDNAEKKETNPEKKKKKKDNEASKKNKTDNEKKKKKEDREEPKGNAILKNTQSNTGPLTTSGAIGSLLPNDGKIEIIYSPQIKVEKEEAQKKREDAEKKKREDAEKKKREDAERKNREEAEAQKKLKDAEIKKRLEEEAQKKRKDAERKNREEAERKKRLEEEAQKKLKEADTDIKEISEDVFKNSSVVKEKEKKATEISNIVPNQTASIEISIDAYKTIESVDRNLRKLESYLSKEDTISLYLQREIIVVGDGIYKDLQDFRMRLDRAIQSIKRMKEILEYELSDGQRIQIYEKKLLDFLVWIRKENNLSVW